jgi:hypothetical protein
MVTKPVDRLRHHCITVRIKGPSSRVPEEPDPQAQDTPAEPEEPEKPENIES